MARRIAVSLPERFDNYDPVHMRCRRAHGHAVESLGHYRFRDNGSQYLVEVLQCSRCDMVREDYFDNDGGYVGSSRVYPEGYVIKYTPEERDAGIKLTSRTVAKVSLKNALANGTLLGSREEVLAASKNGRRRSR